MKIISSDDKISNILQLKNVHSKTILLRPRETTSIQNHHDTELWVIHSGNALLYTKQECFSINPGMQVCFDPFDDHYLSNNSLKDFIFTAYWYVSIAEIDQKIYTQPDQSEKELLIGAAFPTPNGHLHLGHLLGPYFLADIMHKAALLAGQKSTFYCGTFGHENHIDRTAASNGVSYEELITSSESSIIESFDLFGLEINSFLKNYPSDELYEKAKERLTNALLESPCLVKHTVDLPYDEDEKVFVTESYVSGKCPYCAYSTIGIECENCGLFQDESLLVEPFHTETKKKLSKKSVDRWYLCVDDDRLDHIRSILYNEQTESTRHAVKQFERFRAKNLLSKIPVSTIRSRGILFADNQKMSIPIERALRGLHALTQFPTIQQHYFFCGLDNLCASGILVPCILSIIGIPSYQLPIIQVSQLALLNGKKFSTSRKNVIEAGPFLKKYNSEVIRAYFASIYNPKTKSAFYLQDFLKYSKKFVQKLLNIFKTGNSLFSTYNIAPTEAGDWLREDMLFYKTIKESLLLCSRYIFMAEPRSSLRTCMSMLRSLNEYLEMTSFVVYTSDPRLFRTRFILSVYAYRSVFFALFPLMPHITARILLSLGTSRDLFQQHITTLPSVGEVHFDQGILILNEIMLRCDNGMQV